MAETKSEKYPLIVVPMDPQPQSGGSASNAWTTGWNENPDPWVVPMETKPVQSMFDMSTPLDRDQLIWMAYSDYVVKMSGSGYYENRYQLYRRLRMYYDEMMEFKSRYESEKPQMPQMANPPGKSYNIDYPKIVKSGGLGGNPVFNPSSGQTYFKNADGSLSPVQL